MKFVYKSNLRKQSLFRHTLLNTSIEHYIVIVLPPFLVVGSSATPSASVDVAATAARLVIILVMRLRLTKNFLEDFVIQLHHALIDLDESAEVIFQCSNSVLV